LMRQKGAVLARPEVSTFARSSSAKAFRRLNKISLLDVPAGAAPGGCVRR